MDDRELIEWAAKAAGYEIVGDVDQMIGQPDHKSGGYVIRNDRGGEVCWNPLTDDGDALRLAVKLGIDVMHTNIHAPQVHAMADHEVACIEEADKDPYAATRRAITRAAVENGRAMP